MRDLSVFNRFNFERPPVGIKYLLNKPKGIKKLDKILDFCEMLPEAQNGEAFYATAEDFEWVGPRLGIYKEARANRRVYPPVPIYIFSPLLF